MEWAQTLTVVAALAALTGGQAFWVARALDALRHEMHRDVDALRGELRRDVDTLRGEMHHGFDRIEARLERVEEASS